MRKRGEKTRKFNGDMGDLLVKTRPSGKVVSINEIISTPITDRGRRILNKSLKDGTKPQNWNSEYREHIIYQIIYKLIHPFKPKIHEVAKELGLSIDTINSLIRTEEYQRIKFSLRKELRKRWGAEIDAVVIKKALGGSKYHAELFYKLEEELVSKVSVKHEDSIPTEPEQRKAMVRKYLKELGYDVGFMSQEEIDKLAKPKS